MHDVRLALRSLRDHPVVSILAVLSLALGIGANTAIFSLIDGLLLRPLPARDPAALVLLSDTSAPGARSYGFFFWDHVRQHTAGLFDGLLAWSPTEFSIANGNERQIVQGAWVSGSFFETLGVTPLIGRTLGDRDDRPGGGAEGPVAVISHGLWQRRFGGAADAIGRTIALNEVPFTIVGVTPPDFFGVDVGRAADVMVPFAAEPLVYRNSCCLDLFIMARLRAGQTIDAATAALRGMQPRLRAATMPSGPRYRKQDLDGYLSDPFTLLPGATGNSRLRLRYERPPLTMMVAVALVMLIACANIANLLLARAAARQRELSVRLALGASRWRLVRPFFVESALLAAAGAIGGIALATWGSRLVVRQLSTQATPVFLDLSLDTSVLAFTIGTTVCVTLLAGVVPALRAMRAAAHGTAMDVLKSHAGSLASSTVAADGRAGRLGIAGTMLVAQVALSVVLVVGAGLFVRTFVALVRAPLGFDRDRVLMVGLYADRTRLEPEQRRALFERTRAAVRAVPGVKAAAISFITPVSGPVLLRPIDMLDGVPLTLPERERSAAVNLVSPGWFETLGTPITAGRDFDEHDTATTPAVAIVNQTFVRKLLHDANPVGRTLTIGIVGPNAGSVEVIGIAADAVYASLRVPAPPTIYFAMPQMSKLALSSLTLSVRADRGSPLLLSRSVAAAIGDVNPDLAVTFRPLADQIDASMTQERVLTTLSGFLGALAVLLAGLGLFGVTLDSVTRRRRELGIRIALGAAPTRVVRLVLARVALLVGVGIAVGIGLSLWASQFVASLLYGLQPRDPATLATAVTVLASVGLLAGWLPARRAVRIDPAAILRSE